MSKAKFHISSKAIEDLENILLYTSAKWSEEQADRYYMLLIGEMEYLSLNPHAGRSDEHIRPGYRIGIVQSHLIFYRESERGTIEIIRILHQKMNIEHQLM